MNKDIYPKVKIIINKAMIEAKTLDDVKVRPEHIVISILSDNDNECVRVLKVLKVNSVDLGDRIADYLRKSDLTPRLTSMTRTKLPFSEETKAVFKLVD